MNTYHDVLIIGAGPAGSPLAMALAHGGKRVLLVEKSAGPGGTCLFEGCIPSKIFRETARRLRELRQADEFGLHIPAEVQLDWPAVQARKRAILEHRSKAALQRLQLIPGLEYRQGRASFLDSNSACIESEAGNPATIQFGQAVIATGSVPFHPAIEGIEHPRVLNSEAILDIESLPEELLIIGAGPIGVELGQIFRTLGSRVSVLETAPHILGSVDAELSQRLQQHMQAQGIDIQTHCQVDSIKPAGSDKAKLRVNYRYRIDGEEKRYQDADTVLLVTGRRANVTGLGLENTGVKHGIHGIEVNEQLETDDHGIFAVGDVIGQPMFAHWATAQALALARHLLGLPAVFPYPASNTAVIFSEPELAMAGLTEAQAHLAGIRTEVARYDFSQDARAQISGTDNGMLKIIFDHTSHQVVGVQAMVENAGNLMGEAALLIKAGISIEILAAAIHPHPTLIESFAQAVRAVLGRTTPAQHY